MYDHESRATERFEAAVRDALEAASAGKDDDNRAQWMVRAGRDVVFGGVRPANDDEVAAAPNRGPSLELHYALLGLVSFAVLLLIVIVVLLARRELRPIKPSGAASVSAVILLNPCDAAFFLCLLGPIALKSRSNAPFSPFHPGLSHHVPHRSNHLSLHISRQAGRRELTHPCVRTCAPCSRLALRCSAA